MKKIFLSLLVCIMALTASAQVARPKLVVGLVIDQMRWDYMYYYYDKYGEGGSWGGRKWDPALIKGYKPKES